MATKRTKARRTKKDPLKSRKKRGAKGKETWRISRSVSWDRVVFAMTEKHRAKLRMERSDYVKAAMEHLHGIAPHPELFDPKTALTPAEIAECEAEAPRIKYA